MPRGSHARQSGFSYIEVLVSILILAMVATGLAAGLVAASQRMGAGRVDLATSNIAQGVVDDISRMDYNDVGLVAGNPAGTLPATQVKTLNGVPYTVNLAVTYQNDQAGGQPELYANYKKVEVTVIPRRAGAVPLVVDKYLAPPSPGAVRDKATVIPTIMDTYLNQPIQGVNVALTNADFPARNAVTDANGRVVFPLVDPAPTSPSDPGYYYYLTTSLSGYVTSPASIPTNQNLTANQTWSPTINMFAPATIIVKLLDQATGQPITEQSTVTVQTPSPSSLTGTQSGNTGTYTINQIASQPIQPQNAPFTVSVAADCYGSASQSSPVPASGYPTVTSQEFDFTLARQPSGHLNVQVVDAGTGQPIQGAGVQVSGGGPNLSPISRTTDSTGSVSYCVPPSGSVQYVVAVSAPGYTNASSPATVTLNNTTTLQVRLVSSASACTIVLRSKTAGQLVRLKDGGSYLKVQQTNSGRNATFAGLVPGTYYAALATGSDGSGNPVFTPDPGYAVSCSSGQTVTFRF